MSICTEASCHWGTCPRPHPALRLWLINSLQNRVNSITLCITLNVTLKKIVLVTVFGAKLSHGKWRRLHRAWGRVPPLLQMTGHRGTESRRTKHKGVTKLYWPLQKCSLKQLIVLVKAKSGGTQQIFFVHVPPQFVPVPLPTVFINQRLNGVGLLICDL